MTSFAIVVFSEEGDVALVPENWCIGTDRCWWPPFKSPLRFEKAIRSFEQPNQLVWKQYGIRILSTEDSYEKARKKLTQSEITSDLQTDAEGNETSGKRKRKSNKRYDLSSSDNDYDGGDDDDGEDVDQDDDDGDRGIRAKEAESVTLSTSTNSLTARRVQSQSKKSRLAQPPSVPTPLSLPSGSGVQNQSPKAHHIHRQGNAQGGSTSSSTSSSNVTAAQRMILKLLAELKAEVKELKVAVRQQQNRMPLPVQEELVVMPEGVVLPVTDLAGLQKLEEELKSNKALHNHLITSMSEKGGHNLRDVVRRMARILLTNPVASQLNWTGLGTKTAFNSLEIKTLFEKAVRRTASTSSSTDAEIKDEIIYYLKGASDRDGGRQARRQAAAAAAAATARNNEPNQEV